MSKSTSVPESDRSEAATNKVNEGPDRVSKEIDDANEWDEVADEPGFQKGDQGGYKGSYDDTKFEQIQDKDLLDSSVPGNKSIRTGDDDGKKRPMKPGEPTTDRRE